MILLYVYYNALHRLLLSILGAPVLKEGVLRHVHVFPKILVAPNAVYVICEGEDARANHDEASNDLNDDFP